MTATVTIKTGDKAVIVRSSTQSSNEDGSYQSYMDITQKVAPKSELTVSVYGQGSVSVNEEYDYGQVKALASTTPSN